MKTEPNEPTNPTTMSFAVEYSHPTAAAMLPEYENKTLTGLTKREYFAAMAMQGIASDQTFVKPNEPEEIAERAVAMADALITTLNK